MDNSEVKNPDVLSIAMSFNIRTGEVALAGCDENPVVALGMLDYALSRVRRALAMSDIQQEQQRSARIVPGSAFRQ